MIRHDLLLGFLGWLSASSLYAADWPMQRHDAARSGISDEQLQYPLQLRWVLHWPKRNAVFGPDRRSRIDGAYDAAVAGGLVMRDGVICFSCDIAPRCMAISLPACETITTRKTSSKRCRWRQ